MLILLFLVSLTRVSFASVGFQLGRYESNNNSALDFVIYPLFSGLFIDLEFNGERDKRYRHYNLPFTLDEFNVIFNSTLEFDSLKLNSKANEVNVSAKNIADERLIIIEAKKQDQDGENTVKRTIKITLYSGQVSSVKMDLNEKVNILISPINYWKNTGSFFETFDLIEDGIIIKGIRQPLAPNDLSQNFDQI